MLTRLCIFLILWDGHCSPPVKWCGQTNKHKVRGCDWALWIYVCLSRHTRSGAHGPQFASEPFRKFAQDWSFNHINSSLHFSTKQWGIKNPFKKSSNPCLTLMVYHSAPLANGHSPTELLMGRKFHTTVPVLPTQLNPSCPDMDDLKRKEQSYRQMHQGNYNRRHAPCDMPDLQPSGHVWVKDIHQRSVHCKNAHILRHRDSKWQPTDKHIPPHANSCCSSHWQTCHPRVVWLQSTTGSSVWKALSCQSADRCSSPEICEIVNTNTEWTSGNNNSLTQWKGLGP